MTQSLQTMPSDHKDSLQTVCRLCHGNTLYRFNLQVLRTKQVQYFECQLCKSLQTQTPYWLEQAYSENLASSDSGAAQRTLRNLVVSYFISKVAGAHNVLDIGGGDGLLCRFLRDYGLNSFVRDKYSRPIYAQQFTEPNFERPDLVLAFEVLEHFANPMEELEELFNRKSNFYLFSTGIYSGEGQDWWYLVPSTGQHVFFYSNEAFKLIAEKFNLRLIVQGNLIFLYKTATLNKLQALLIKLLMRREISWLLRSVVVLLPSKGVAKDHELEDVVSTISSGPKH